MDNIRDLDVGEVQQDEKSRREYTLHNWRENAARSGRLQYLTRLHDTQANTTQALRRLIATMGKFTGTDTTGRALICTPAAGDHGHITSWTISVAGSPPRGTIFIAVLDDVLSTSYSVFFVNDGKSRRIGGKQQKVVLAFMRQMLGGFTYRLIEGVLPLIVAEHMG